MIDKILSKNTCFGDIFPNDLIKSKTLYRDLCKQYHPDVCSDCRADDAFAKLSQFYEEAVAAIESGTWYKSDYIEFHTTTGKTLQINYQYRGIFELGEYYVCKRNIIYAFDFSKKKYYNNYIEKIKKLPYANSKMKDIFNPLVPKVIAEHETTNDKHIIVLSKTEEVYPLRAVLDNFYGGKIPGRHIAWMISRMMNLACYLDYAGLVHNGFNVDSCFVSLKFHSILLEGGWWYTVPKNEKMFGTTKDIYDVMSPKVKSEKTANITTDIESIKAFGRKCAADDTPKELIDFFNSGSSEKAVKEMEKWDKALEDGFGKRRFIKIEATDKDIYKKENK